MKDSKGKLSECYFEQCEIFHLILLLDLATKKSIIFFELIVAALGKVCEDPRVAGLHAVHAFSTAIFMS